MKPKVWGDQRLTDAIAVGEARARFNNALDLPYVSASGPGFQADKAGQFSSITVTGGEETKVEPSLFCDGIADGKEKRKGADSPGAAFRAVRIKNDQYNLGNGFSSEVGGDQPYVQESRRVFQRVDESDASYLNFGWYPGTKLIQFYKRGFIGSIEQDFQTVAYTYQMAGNTLWQYEPLGRKTKENQALNVLFVTAPNGVNEWGYELTQPLFLKVEENCSIGYGAWLPILSDHPGRQYHLGRSFCYGPDKIGLFVSELPLDGMYIPPGSSLDWRWVNDSDPLDGTYEAPEGAQGRILLYLSDDGGDSWNIRVFTGLDFIVTPDHLPTSELGRPQPFLGYFWMANRPGYWASRYGNVGFQGIRLADFAVTTSIAVFSEDVFVVFTALSDARIYGGTWSGLRGFAFRTDDQGVTWTKIETPLSTELPIKTYDCTPTILRQGICLLRCDEALSGLNRNVRWMLSEDSGVTWEEIFPTGLPASTNERIGYPEVFRVSNIDGELVSDVGLVCYDDTEQAYVMYRSADDGRTWKKSSTVQKSETFIRCDFDRIAGPYSQPSLNFGVLDYRGTIEKPQPLDVAQPWLYDALILPPP